MWTLQQQSQSAKRPHNSLRYSNRIVGVAVAVGFGVCLCVCLVYITRTSCDGSCSATLISTHGKFPEMRSDLNDSALAVVTVVTVPLPPSASDSPCTYIKCNIVADEAQAMGGGEGLRWTRCGFVFVFAMTCGAR